MIKVNIENYKKVTKDIDFSKLSKSIQDADKDFADFAEFYDDDLEIEKMLDNHFKAIEKELNKKTNKPKELKKRKKEYRISLNEGSYQFDQYFSSSSITAVRSSAKKKMQELYEHRATNESIWGTIDEKKGADWEEVDRIKFKTKGQDMSKSKPQKKESKTKKNTKRTPKQAIHKEREVAVMPMAIRIMKRYLMMDGKSVTERQVTLFYRMIQRAATEGTIRKTNEYAELIKAIGKDLAATYKEMNGKAKFEIPSSLKKKIENVVDDYGIKPSVALIKRFINLYGGITPEKANRLLKSIDNAKKNGKVQKTDSTFAKIEEIESHLEKYIQSDKLIVTDIQLNGLKGVASKK